MSNKHLDITVKIDIIASNGSFGFGVPLILVTKAETEIPFTKVSGIKEVLDLLCGGEDDETTKKLCMQSETYRTAKLLFMQDNAPSEIAICHSTEGAETAIMGIEEKDWRQLICIFGTGDTADEEDVADTIESLDYKMYYLTTDDVAVASAIKEKGYDRTVMYFYDKEEKDDIIVVGEDGKVTESEETYIPNAVAALIGESAGREVGSFTYKNLILKGITALDKTTNELSQIDGANAITNIEKCGDNVTTEGKCASGEYIDIIDSIDYIIGNMEYRVQKLLNNSPKIPYTDSGIGSIESEVKGVLEMAYRNGIIADDAEGLPMYQTNFKSRSQMSAQDRANRIYTGGNFRFDLAGAIHKVSVQGELVI